MRLPALEVEVGAQALRRGHVDVGPELAVRADLDHRGVERAVRGADLLEAVEVAGVTAVVDPVLVTGDHPGGPEGVLGVAQAAPAEVAGRGRGQGEAADLGLLVPVQLAQPVGGHAPVLQVRADAQRDGEQGVRVGQRLDRGHVQVVVVVVRDDDDVDRAERGQRQGHRVQALGSGERERGAAVAPDRVEEDPVAVDLREHAGVAHPGQSQAGRGGPGQVGEGGGVHGQVAGGGAAGALLLVEVGLAHPAHRASGRADARVAPGVLEDPVLEMGGSTDARQALAARVRAEGLGLQRAEPGAEGTDSGHGSSRWSRSGFPLWSTPVTTPSHRHLGARFPKKAQSSVPGDDAPGRDPVPR